MEDLIGKAPGESTSCREIARHYERRLAKQAGV